MPTEEVDGWRGESQEILGGVFFREMYPHFYQLPEEIRRKFSKELTPLTGKGFMRLNLESEELVKDVENHIVPAPRLIIIRDKTKNPVAFIASELKETEGLDFYHLGGIMIDENLHHTGLGLKILTDEITATKSQAIVFRTQSKKMLGLAKKVAALNEKLTHKVAPTFYPTNLDGMINRRVYRNGHSLYEDEERFAPQAIDWIDWLHGDGLVVAGFIHPI